MRFLLLHQLPVRLRRAFSPYLLFPALVFALLLSSSNAGAQILPISAASRCTASSPPSAAYIATLCLASPANGASLSGNVTVRATVTFSGTAPRIQRVTFYMDNNYLLTDFQSGYIFVLPTTKWVDGSHAIAVEATMTDGFVTQRSGIAVSFHNGITSPPVNPNHFTPTAGRTPAAGTPFIVAAGGDGASGQSTSQDVSSMVVNSNPNLFLYLGDVYDRGSVAEFRNWYGSTSTFFGRLRAITDPTVGNHEQLTPQAHGYYDYWNNIPKYYSFNAHGWHIISLNSNSTDAPTGAGSAQYNWLQNDLSGLSSQTCTLVFYHHPYFNIGPQGGVIGMRAIWQLLAQYHVDIVLNGHDHDYQRWVPLDGDGNVNSNGITEFVAGAAGHGLQTVIGSDARVAYSNDANPAAFGALFLQLNPRGANFSYRNMNRRALDSGVIPCKTMSIDSTAPTTPSALTGSAISGHHVKLTWKPSTDNVGVVGYRVFRNGALIATVRNVVPGSLYTFIDSATAASTSYHYTVYAYDPSNNHSGTAGPITVITSAAVPDFATIAPAGAAGSIMTKALSWVWPW